MKKLIITVAIVCAAVCTNAATMKWASGGMYDPVSSTTQLSGATAQLFVLTAEQYGALQTTVTDLSVDKAQAAIFNAYAKESADATSTGWRRGAVSLTDTSTYDAGDTAYAVVIYTKTVDEKDYYIANMGEWTFETDIDKTQPNMGTNFLGVADGAALSWQTVPEPTSGLLLLLGMGALALRRKRA